MEGRAGQAHNVNLAAMAAAAVGEQQGGSLGAAVYLLASLFNHSCSPNVEVTFPMNNSESQSSCTCIYFLMPTIKQSD